VVFFLVSGYIIIHVLQTEKPVEFLIKRAFRIYPLYFVAVLGQYAFLAIDGQSPDWGTLLSQLSLLGDFFGTPNALNGVEWTLRVEVMFYLFMAALRYFNLNSHNKLTYIFITTTLLCGYISPIPYVGWAKGFATYYFPFLLLGSMFYLFEKGLRLSVLVIFIILVFFNYFHLTGKYHPDHLGLHFMILAFFIFLIAWAFREHLQVTGYVLLLSDMTYAVYLFHNWFFEYAKRGLAHFKVSVLNPDIQALIVLLIVCFMMTKYIEKSSIRLGRAVVTKFASRSSAWRS